MCGIIVDMTIINILIRDDFPKLIPLLDNKNENYGDYVGNNFINVNLINLFTNQYINKDTSLLIWDLLFIDGNIILIKTFLAIYHYLLPMLLESNPTIEDFQKIINKNLNKLDNENKDLIFYLVIKDYKYTEESIEQARFSLSIDTANTIQKEKNYNSMNTWGGTRLTDSPCDVNWPICRYNNENINKVVFFNIHQRKEKKCIENYFTEIISNKNKEIKDNKDCNDENDNNNIEDLLIERNVHLCHKMNEKNISDKKNKEIINDNEKINKEINYNRIINKPEFIEASKNVLNHLQIKIKDDNENKQHLNKNK